MNFIVILFNFICEDDKDFVVMCLSGKLMEDLFVFFVVVDFCCDCVGICVLLFLIIDVDRIYCMWVF